MSQDFTVASKPEQEELHVLTRSVTRRRLSNAGPFGSGESAAYDPPRVRAIVM